MPPSIAIAAERPDTPDAVQLIEELEGVLAPLYPVTSRHGLSVARLISEGVHFFLIRVDGAPVGCGGVKIFDEGYGEVKRMFIRPGFRGMGLARQMLDRLAATARSAGVDVLRLETGIHQHEAIRLYEGWGFGRIGPFGDYKEDPLSIFFEKSLA